MALTVTANTPATAAQYNALIPKYLLQTADQSITSSTASTNHNTFAGISIGAGEVWVFDVFMDVDGAQAGDIRTSWSFTGTAAGLSRRHVRGQASTTVVDSNVATPISMQARASTSVTTTGVTPETGSAPNTVRGSLSEHFVVEGGISGGTISLQWAQGTSSGTATTVRAGSYLIGHRVS